MNLNQTTQNALVVMGHIAQLPKGQFILAKQLSIPYNLNIEYLMKILSNLCRANILHSKRGPHGGYALAKPANNISLHDVIQAVYGPLQDFQIDPQYQSHPFIQKMTLAHLTATNKAVAILKQAKLSEMIKQPNPVQ